MENTITVQSAVRLQGQHGAVSSLSPAGIAEVLDCKAVWRLELQGAWLRWHSGGHGCSGTQEGGTGSAPSGDQVVRAGVGQLWKKREESEVRN